MTAVKVVAGSLTTLLQNPIVLTILDRSADITPIIEEVKSWWGYDLMNRKPSPAYNDYGIFTGTDLDLACFLYALAGRGAVINLPEYKAHTKSKIREDQVRTSTENRHGKLVGVGGNKHFFSFNINIIDENIIGTDKVGYLRRFSLTDKTGGWYDGWKKVEFVPTINENKFLTENELWSGHTVAFKNFIHPNRWTSVFGQHYIITRLLMDRLEEEGAFLFKETKRLQDDGIKFPKGDGPSPPVSTTYGNSKQEKFTAFEMKVFMPETQFTGAFSPLDDKQISLVEGYKKRGKFIYSDIPQLRFMTRASEYAHYKAQDRMPAWIKNTSWEAGFKIPPRGRTNYDRLKLFQDKVGEHSISLLRRTYSKSATVAA